MNVLIDLVLVALAERSDFFVGGNMFVYYSRTQAMNRDFRGPDFLLLWRWMAVESGKAGWCGKKRGAIPM